MGQDEDLYKVLMVDRSVDSDILEAVYRRLAGRYQPGAGGGGWAAGRLAAVERAYAILRDPHLRARYDARSAAHDEPAYDAVPPTAAPAAAQVAWAAQQPPASAAAAPAMVRVVAERHPVGSSGGVLDFGRYAGWSLRQLAAHDPDYLEWLVRSPGGRQYRGQITALLAR